MALAKVRALHPDFFSDEAVAEVSIPARLLFAGLWCFACDNGHLADKPKQIKRWIYATDDVNTADLLRELEGEELIERGDGWIFIRRLAKRQRIDYRYFKTCDRDDCAKPEKEDSQRETPRAPVVATQSPVVPTRGPATDGDGVGVVDGEGESSAPPTKPSTRGRKRPATRLPEDWKPSEQHWEKRNDGIDVEREAQAFRLHAEANDRRQANWNAAFSQWLLRARPSATVHQLRTDAEGRPVLPPLPSRSPWGQS
jgi:hypothetical protein